MEANVITATSIRVKSEYCTEVRFASFLSGGFTTRAVINPLERKHAKYISVYCPHKKSFFGFGIVDL